ncbi:hypothetical protein SAMN00777080_0671 [Aquiflexum balticum DSM 16537]|jgi:hypothetical protein|uniref:Uncharacterized protein n=1 Tax=Aquiflexum balticum DSM 16537 TaxID=758820 RepID=A0A1W2H031_9BACT|nr:hypothetical protein SAMN00777080_0671 [Aquiflexum balticum DSM 16537]
MVKFQFLPTSVIGHPTSVPFELRLNLTENKAGNHTYNNK